jgi:hypothetical protein
MQTQPTFEKSIQYDRTTKDYAAYLDGQLIGLYSSHHAAEVALDQVSYERLTHGDCATATELDGGTEDDPEAVNWNSATTSTEEYPICESCQTREFPPSCILPRSCVSCANARYWGFVDRFAATQFAVTRQSLAIEARLAVCGNCQGIHHIQHCPEIHARLAAEPVSLTDRPWYDVTLGRELCRMKWRNFQAFVALLLSVPTEHLVIYAASYQSAW